MRPAPPRSRRPPVAQPVTLAVVLCGALLAVPGGAAADVLDPSHAALLYTGRWDGSDPSQPWAQAQLSTVTANFEGTSIRATFDTVSGEYSRIIVDGDSASSVKMALASGVARVFDPADALHGSHYLQLADGAYSQQTNPADDGETFNVVVWMRGVSDGDEVDITLSFRDQEAGAWVSCPMQSDTETRVLSAGWRPYTMAATAPLSPSNPVYSVRVHFEAEAGDVVEIDAIAMPEPAGGLLLAVGALGLRCLAAVRLRGRR